MKHLHSHCGPRPASRGAPQIAAVLSALALGLLCALLPSRPVQASPLGGTLGAVLGLDKDLSCDLKLGGASGVPNGTKHTYAFTGTCISHNTGVVLLVSATGAWDSSKFIADEAVNIDQEGSGGLGGGIVTKFRCTSDPWLGNALSVNCSVIERHTTTLPNNFSYSYPATADYVTLAEASELSKHHADVAPPPPPPPAAPPKTVRRPRVLTDNHRAAPGAINGFANGRGTVMQRKKNTAASMQVPPRVRVIQRNDKVDYQCANLQKLITIRETLYNGGGPLAAHHAMVYAKEDGGAHLGSHAISVPPMAHGARTQLTIPIGTSASYRAKLPGIHHVSVYLKVDGKPKAFFLTLSLPKGYCQSRLMRSPTNVRRKAGSGTGSRTPGTTSPTHRLTLPVR